MRKVKKILFVVKDKVTILVDGETEFWYLQMIKRNNRKINIDIKPEIPQKKKIEDQYKRAIELSKIYDKVIWIVNLDVVIDEGKLEILVDYRKELENKYNNIIIIFNQPCLEYWFALHFKFSQPPFTNCSEASHILKKSVTNYEKKEVFFTKQNDDIFLKLKANLPNAIENSRKCGDFDVSNPQIGFSEMYKLFDLLKLTL